MTALIVTYIVLGGVAMGIAALALSLGDPCGLFAASSSGSPYDDFMGEVMGGFGFLYLLGSVPMAIWRNRKIAWVVVVVTFVVVTVGAVAVVATAAPAGTFCDLGGGS